MKLAEKFHRPVICFVDTPAADVNVGAEQRGISGAIARNMMEMATLKTPVVVVVIGEGGSGGAIGIALGDRVLMLEHSIYAVIPPEGFAAIVWKDAARGKDGAEVMKVTSEGGRELGLVDEVVKEPLGGAHRNMDLAARNLKAALVKHIDELLEVPIPELLDTRYKKFRGMGAYSEKMI
jgi:acetyl-CoA carboxylase carboxyl transferase subunit alpha